MRVIAGVYRSRLLTAPRGLATRPTSDRLRETLFNVLSARVEGAVFADLYAGSGAVGIEAISRGARLVYFVDQAPSAVAAIRANLASLQIKSGFKIESATVASGLRRLEERCSIVFLDPPYAAEEDYAKTLASIGARADTLLTGDGIVVVEHSKKMHPGEKIGPLERYRVLTQGDAGLSFYRQTA
jgi:16S rRNA (guanine(966)-N(2))-methyltransferase RsmD